MWSKNSSRSEWMKEEFQAAKYFKKVSFRIQYQQECLYHRIGKFPFARSIRIRIPLKLNYLQIMDEFMIYKLMI